MKWVLFGLGIAALAAVAGGGAWLMSLPGQAEGFAAPVVSQAEADAIRIALKPPKRTRPLIAIIGANAGTEVTDYLMPYGILRRADVADVVAVATAPGPLKLFPALTVEADTTTDGFDRNHPEGADYVIVPAMARDDDPAVLNWLRGQAGKGATIIGACVGAKVVGAAGLLAGRRATTHWYSIDELRAGHPTMTYVADRRLVVDRGVATTTGITASMPMALTLIEAIAGRERALDVARGLGVSSWDARHDSSAFRFTRPFALTAIVNRAAVWRHERIGVPVYEGIDEVSLALVTDAWSRTWRARAVATTASGAPVTTRGGLRLLPDSAAPAADVGLQIAPGDSEPPANLLDTTIASIADRYGTRTAAFVAAQLEYPDQRPGL